MAQKFTIIAFIGIILGFFMALLDATIVNIAIPDMMKAFKANIDDISWVTNAYNLAFAVLILVGARFADQFGRKKFFIGSLIIFTLSSLLASVSQDLNFLIFARILQGLSGAILVPVTIPIAMAMFPKEKHGFVMGVWGGVSGLAAALGPFLGGILTSAIDWRAIFWVNIPIGIVSLIIALVLVKESKDEKATKKHDILGMLTISAALFALVYALVNVHEWGWTDIKTLSLMGTFVLLVIAFIFIEMKTREPMLPLGMFKNRIFSIASFGLLLFGAAILGAVFLISFFLRVDLGLDTLTAGMVMAATPFASMIVSVIAGPLSVKMNHKYLAAAGSVIAGLVMYFSLGLNSSSSTWDAVWRLSLLGVGIGLFMAPVIGTAVRAVPEDKIGMASGVTNMTRAVGGVLGVAILVAVLQSGMSTEMASAQSQVKTIISEDSVFPKMVKEGFLQKFDDAQVSSNKSEFDGSIKDSTAAIFKSNLSDLVTGVNSALLQKGLPGLDLKSNLDEVEIVSAKISKTYLLSAEMAFENSFRVAMVIAFAGALLMLFSGPKLENENKGSVVISEA